MFQAVIPGSSICNPSFKFLAQGHVMVRATIDTCQEPKCFVIGTCKVIFPAN